MCLDKIIFCLIFSERIVEERGVTAVLFVQVVSGVVVACTAGGGVFFFVVSPFTSISTAAVAEATSTSSCLSMLVLLVDAADDDDEGLTKTPWLSAFLVAAGAGAGAAVESMVVIMFTTDND